MKQCSSCPCIICHKCCCNDIPGKYSQECKTFNSGLGICNCLSVGCILISHNKPNFVFEALNSVLAQDYPYWQLLIVDTGSLAEILAVSDNRVQVIISEETEQIRKSVAVASWCFNTYLPRLNTDLIVYLCDDDVFYPNAFRDFAQFLGRNPNIMACYGSEDYGIYRVGDFPKITGQRVAKEIGGKGFSRMDCKVDYLQLCHRQSLLKMLSHPWWPDDLRHKRHLDGLFLEKIGAITPVYPMPVKIGMNRRTTQSINVPLKG